MERQRHLVHVGYWNDKVGQLGSMGVDVQACLLMDIRVQMEDSFVVVYLG
jgi:hypothetical protein